jgi:hypothetical protein
MSLILKTFYTNLMTLPYGVVSVFCTFNYKYSTPSGNIIK